MNDENIKEELRSLGPKLSRIKKDNPFRIPDSYFNTLPDQVLNNLRSEQSRSPKSSWQQELSVRITHLFTPRTVIAIAAISVIMIITITIWISNVTENPHPGHFSDIPQDDLHEFLLDNTTGYDYYFDETTWNTIAEDELNIFSASDIDDETLHNYIFDNIDENTIKELYHEI